LVVAEFSLTGWSGCGRVCPDHTVRKRVAARGAFRRPGTGGKTDMATPG